MDYKRKRKPKTKNRKTSETQFRKKVRMQTSRGLVDRMVRAARLEVDL